MLKLLWFVVTLSTLDLCKSASILGVFPAPILSHQLVFKSLTQELAKRGHNVTVVTALSVAKYEEIDNYTEIDLSHIGMEVRSKLLVDELNQVHDMFHQFKTTLKLVFKYINTIIQSHEVQNLIKYQSFDLILIEDCSKSALILSHLIKAPVIYISSFGGSFDTFETVGGVVHPILYPLATRKRFHYLSTWDKISELSIEYKLQNFYNELETSQDEINKKIYGEDTPTLNELKTNVQMIFLNIHSIWDSNRPVPPNVIYLGGLHRKPQKALPKDLKSSLDSSVRGAIYVSFGTSVDCSIFTEKMLQILINVFSKLPYDVYWKWNNELPRLPQNVKISKWFPQSDLLQHPNIKLFITQGGLQSTDEAIAAGVPLIGLPILWDQWFNVDKYVQLKIGLQIDIEKITEDELESAIKTVIGDKEYTHNILKLRSIMFDTPQSSLDRAVWWTEYVLRHGGEHLRAPSANVSWVDYYEIEIVLYLVAIVTIAMTLVIIVLRCTLKSIIKKSKLNKTKIH
ncbi:UDP-glucosyltransferase 2-like [Vanessa atalanta]|uniref:UDP-glucosyltransferase 2-like n=1 Tax=Vanessa atalanta TaxID=42275 RepID=UPI001FCCD2F7|nr:UDP-glucosyltransferase 2-like [Vanessa atalanta]